METIMNSQKGDESLDLAACSVFNIAMQVRAL